MQPITNEDVLDLLPLVPYLDSASLADHDDLDAIRNYLVMFGIRNRQQLERFVKAKDIFDFLRGVYVHDLKRSGDHPLDPTAVAAWGAILFTRGNQADVQREVVKRLRQSDEYRQKHEVPAS